MHDGVFLIQVPLLSIWSVAVPLCRPLLPCPSWWRGSLSRHGLWWLTCGLTCDFCVFSCVLFCSFFKYCIFVFVLLCFCVLFCALSVILSLLLVIMGGQHDGVFLSGSPPILHIYIHMYIFLMANKLCCCCLWVILQSISSVTSGHPNPTCSIHRK